MSKIHPTAIIESGAQIADDVSIGPYSIIGPHVKIGAGTKIHAHARITGKTRIGENCELFHGVVVGEKPQVLGIKDGNSAVVIGDRTVLREYVTINGASEDKPDPTTLGSDCFMMVNTHIGHDVQISDKCVFAANVMVGGHARIGYQVWLGGGSGVHQLSFVGDHSFLGGGCILTGDLIPYVVAEGDGEGFSTLNAVGLSRRGFSRSDLKEIRQIIRAIFVDDGTVFKDRVVSARTKFEGNPYADKIISFIESPRLGRKLSPYKG